MEKDLSNISLKTRFRRQEPIGLIEDYIANISQCRGVWPAKEGGKTAGGGDAKMRLAGQVARLLDHIHAADY
jgi:hypothetical protein